MNGLFGSRALGLCRKANLVKLSNIHTRSFSVSTSNFASETKEQKYFRTQDENPFLHDKSHIGRFYTVPKDQVTYNEEGLKNVQDMFPKDFVARGRYLDEFAILVRPHIVKALDIYRQIPLPELKQPLSFVLWGQTGAGKSISLSHLYHFALSDPKMLVVNFGSLLDWLKRYKEISASDENEGMYDHIGDSRLLLQRFIADNSEKLEASKDLLTKDTYVWSNRESTPAGSHIIEIAKVGVDRPKFSVKCLTALLKELQSLCSEDKTRVGLVIESINLLFGTDTQVNKDEPIFTRKALSNARARRMCQVNELTAIVTLKNFLLAHGPNRVLFTNVDRTKDLTMRSKVKINGNYHWRPREKVALPVTGSDFPFTLLGQEGWETLDPFVPIEVPLLTRGELDTMIDFYLDKGYFTDKIDNKTVREEIRFLTNGNAGEFTKLSSMW